MTAARYPSWASESVAALVAGGYVNGANGMLNLKNNITRAEFAKVITGMAASYVGAEGVSGKTVEGNVIVRESGASLSGMTINGDLIIADSADKASLDNVKVTGRIVIRGGADAVGIKDTTAGKGVLVSSPNGAAAISVSGGSVGTVTAKSDLSLSGSVSNVAVTDKATLTVEKNASVGTVTVSAAGSKVTGDGKVTNVQANANNVTVTSKGAKVTAGSGVSGVKAGDKAVEAGKTETVGTASTSSGGSSGGGSSSSRSDYSYVLMNIPYDEFYKAELNENAAAVDAVSSATKNKTRNGSLAGGSYHVNPDGSDITGVTYPVRVKTSDLSGLKQVTDSDSVSITVKNKKDEDETSTYIGKDALFESASYSYYVLSSTPSYYKEATLTNGKWSFGKATGAASEATATIAKFKAPGHHANYEMEIESDKIAKGKKVYAVVLTATDGTSCGLHHVTEIWHVTKLGFKADPALVGKTISAVTYYTEDGIIKLNLAQPQYIPYIAKDAKAEVAKSDADAKSTTLTLTGFPEDFKQEVKVPDGMTYSDGKITFGSALPGSYTVTVSDAKNKYASVSTTFVLSTNTAVADYNDTSKSLVKATDASDTAFANYLKNITSVKIGETTYNVSDKDAVKIIKDDGSIDENVKVNGEALFADGQKRTLVISATGYPALSVEYTPTYTYAYAAVPYDEYWRSEGVYLSGDNWAASNSEQDSRKEYDKGAFDAVSRATTMHGRHRGSFQQNVVIDTKDNNKYTPVYWIGADTAVVSTGEQVTLNKTNIQDYKICGIKYVPVKVLSSDFTAFSNKYTVTQNGETLAGGFAEGVLKTYNLTAAVDADTNGLKAVTKNEDGTFTFAARQTGTGSGIEGENLATAANITTTPARNDDNYGATGSYGETIRVNLKGDGYGALGDKMQTVVWEYYGSDSTRTNKVATYGTKFAADNWMHKSMGIQLGLTDSLRCNVSETEGKGIGYWKVTVYALGYEDYSTEFEITADNLPKVYGPITDEQKAQLKKLADKAEQYLDNDATKYPEQVSKKTLQDHYQEATEMLQDTSKKENEAAELITELTGYLAKMDAANASTEPTTRTETGSATVGAYGYDAQVTVTFGADGKVISVDGSNTVPGGNSGYWNLLAGTTNAKNNFWTQFNGLDKAGIEALKVNPTGMLPNTGDDNADAVSGATYSSKAVKDAILNALSK